MRLGPDRRNGTTGLHPGMDLNRIETQHIGGQSKAQDLSTTPAAQDRLRRQPDELAHLARGEEPVGQGRSLAARIHRVSDQRWRIHWGWVPAAIFLAVIGWSRYGWWLVLLIALGVGVGVYGEWKARKRRAKDH